MHCALFQNVFLFILFIPLCVGSSWPCGRFPRRGKQRPPPAVMCRLLAAETSLLAERGL